jgi:hypothetical protein
VRECAPHGEFVTYLGDIRIARSATRQALAAQDGGARVQRDARMSHIAVLE